MKKTCFLWVGALCCSFTVAGTTYGQRLRQPISVQPTAFNYNRYQEEATASPSDQAPLQKAAEATPSVADTTHQAVPSVAEEVGSGVASETPHDVHSYSAAPIVQGSGSCGCQVEGSCPSCTPCSSSCSSCDSCGGWFQLDDWDLGEAWTLSELLFGCQSQCLADCGWTIGGFSQWGYQDGPDGAFTGNGPFLNQKEWNRLNLNQQYMYLGKAADGSQGIGLGFRADVMYGVDGNEGQSFGNVDPGHYDFLNGWDHGSYEWAMPQLYGEVAVGEDLLVKVGHFYTIVGYEVVPSNGQFFLSRQLTFWNSEPFTHTGALGTYKANDKLTINAGWVLGMDSGFHQFQNASSFLGGFTYQVNEDTSFIYSTIVGDLGWRGNGAINSMILSQKWTDRVSSVHQFDVMGTDLRQANGAPADFRDPNSLTARDSIGFINYLFYQMNNAVKAGGRMEWYKADSVSYYTLTGGVNVQATANVIVRPEVRKMWSPGNEDIYVGSGFNDQLFNQTVFGVDAIVTF